mmetsp:Transcript_48980/g.149110  ORF Transcript_48980/g.149110 Transcript_48980/m.149110 type:complete len:219 (+) Transcript_48980:337-993(+)
MGVHGRLWAPHEHHGAPWLPALALDPRGEARPSVVPRRFWLGGRRELPVYRRLRHRAQCCLHGRGDKLRREPIVVVGEPGVLVLLHLRDRDAHAALGPGALRVQERGVALELFGHADRDNRRLGSMDIAFAGALDEAGGPRGRRRDRSADDARAHPPAHADVALVEARQGGPPVVPFGGGDHEGVAEHGLGFGPHHGGLVRVRAADDEPHRQSDDSGG